MNIAKNLTHGWMLIRFYWKINNLKSSTKLLIKKIKKIKYRIKNIYCIIYIFNALQNILLLDNVDFVYNK